MARPITVKFFRSEIIRKKLEALPPQMLEPVRRAMANAGDKVVERAKALVPVDEGVLRDAITWGYIQNEKRVNNQAIWIGPSGQYLVARGRPKELPRWIEFGTAPSEAGKKGVRFGRGGKLRQTAQKATRTAAGQPPRPFLFPAWRQLKKQAREMIKIAINKVLGASANKWAGKV